MEFCIIFVEKVYTHSFMILTYARKFQLAILKLCDHYFREVS